MLALAHSFLLWVRSFFDRDEPAYWSSENIEEDEEGEYEVYVVCPPEPMPYAKTGDLCMVFQDGLKVYQMTEKGWEKTVFN